MCPATRAGATGPPTSAACPTREIAFERCAITGRRGNTAASLAMGAVVVSIAAAVPSAWFAAQPKTTSAARGSTAARAHLSSAIPQVGTTAARLGTIAADRSAAGRAPADGPAGGQGCPRCAAPSPTQGRARPWFAILARRENCAAPLVTGAVADWTAVVVSTVSLAAEQDRPTSAAPDRIRGYAWPTSAIRSAVGTAAISGMAAATRSTAGRARRDKFAGHACAACAALRARFAIWFQLARTPA